MLLLAADQFNQCSI
jgi:adenylosuccinate synthase